jgi:hypothetical protein
VCDDECTVLWEVELKEPLDTTCDVPPPTLLDWLEKVPEDWLALSKPPCELLTPWFQPED